MSRRDEMIKSIKQGNSIILMDGFGGFKQYTLANIEELPSDAELALGDAKEEKKALAAIEKQVAELEAAKKKLEASQKKAEASAAKDFAPEPVVTPVVAEEKSYKSSKKGAKNAPKVEESAPVQEVSDEAASE